MALEIEPPAEIIRPEWDVAPHVHVAATCRVGGVSTAGYRSLNLATHVGDAAHLVRQNRERLRAALNLPEAPRWIEQRHSPVVVCADDVRVDVEGADDSQVAADGTWTTKPGTVCAVLTADCLPVMLCDAAGTRVAAIHAGWRGLAAGILDRILDVYFSAGIAADQIRVWFGPAIGPDAYEVDRVVRDAFLRLDPACRDNFMENRPGRWQFSLCDAARVLLAARGVVDISGGALCTFGDERFYSYRRDPLCGRQVSLIWLTAPADEK